MREDFKTRSSPCEDCKHTGRCSECGGTGLVDGEECYCGNGKCFTCMGTGTEVEVLYKGRSISFYVRHWRRWLGYGTLILILGIWTMYYAMVQPDYFGDGTRGLLIGAAVTAAGLGLIGFCLWIRMLALMAGEIWSAQYPRLK